MKSVAIAVAVTLPLAFIATSAPAQARADRGSLQVVAEGVPAGKTAKIMIARKGFRKKVPTNGKLRNLSPGKYRVWASPIVVDDGIAAVPNLPLKVRVKKRARATLRLGYSWNRRVDFYPPDPAQSLRVTGRAVGYIQLAWKNGTSPDTQSVQVRRKVGRIAPEALDEGKVIQVGQRASSLLDTDVRAGVTYSYSVFMVDTAGNASTAVSVTTRTFGRADLVSAGLSHTCAVVDDPSADAADSEDNQVVCWGADGYGQLGDGGGADSPIPLNVDVPEAVKVAAGGHHACAVTAVGDLWCWGRNDDGQLGTGSMRATDAPVQVKISAVRDVAVGIAHTCAVMESGGVKCWGANGDGQTGRSATKHELSPVNVAGMGNAVEVTAGDTHSCARLLSGAVKCWGANDRGQLGSGSGPDSSSPVLVALTDAQSISAGVNHTCADVRNDKVECWGGNKYGQLGDGTTIDRDEPVPVPLQSASSVSAGAYHSCATVDGDAFCWGRNNSGRLGDGTTTDRLSPTPVISLDQAGLVAAGGYHSCALTVGRAVCWGANGSGQLGDLTTEGSLSPVVVDGL